MSDNCPGAKTTNDAPSVYYTGTTVVTWTITDGSGNFARCQQRVTVQDITQPTITCPSEVSLTAGQACRTSSAFIGTATGTDACGNPAITSNAPLEWTSVGTFTVTYTATDKSGNAISCIQTVTITDTTNPTVTCPATVTATAGSTCTAIISLGIPVVGDNCGVASSVATNALPGLEYPKGSHKVNWLVTDNAGLTASCNQTVIVTYSTSVSIACNLGDLGGTFKDTLKVGGNNAFSPLLRSKPVLPGVDIIKTNLPGVLPGSATLSSLVPTVLPAIKNLNTLFGMSMP
jgi:hypothetical protein